MFANRESVRGRRGPPIGTQDDFVVQPFAPLTDKFISERIDYVKATNCSTIENNATFANMNMMHLPFEIIIASIEFSDIF